MAQLILIAVSTAMYLVYWLFNSKPTSYTSFLTGVQATTIGATIAVFILMWMGLATIDEIVWRVACQLIGYVLAYIIVKMIVPSIMPKREQSA